MIELASSDVTVRVSPDLGGRVAAIEHQGFDVLVTGDAGSDPLLWGSYPMVPFAGRLRHGRFLWNGRPIALPLDMPPHAIHGSGYRSSWDVLDDGPTHVELSTPLTWPLGGTAHQHLQLTDDALVCVLSVQAGDQAIPVVLGWHPWFVKPLSNQLHFGRMYLRDDEYVPSGDLVAPPVRPWDDCFVEPRGPLVLHYPGDLSVTVASDCDHWVVYDQPANATCVEPQTGPPDAFNLGVGVLVVEPGDVVSRTMTIAWQR
jgi:aldose 1-epimerase